MRRWTRKAVVLGAAMLTVQAGLTDAQILRRPVERKQPNWIGGGLGIYQSFALRDGMTDSQWAFDSGLGYTAIFEHPTSSGIMVGVQGSYAKPDLIYTSSTPSGGTSCQTGCDASATVMQIMGMAKSGNSYSFHGVYQLTLGATGFSDFKAKSSNAKLGSRATDFDFSIAIGYGFGFGFSSTTAVEIVQEVGTVLHQKTGLPVGTGNYPRMYVTRLAAKLAF